MLELNFGNRSLCLTSGGYYPVFRYSVTLSNFYWQSIGAYDRQMAQITVPVTYKNPQVVLVPVLDGNYVGTHSRVKNNDGSTTFYFMFYSYGDAAQVFIYSDPDANSVSSGLTFYDKDGNTTVNFSRPLLKIRTSLNVEDFTESSQGLSYVVEDINNSGILLNGSYSFMKRESSGRAEVVGYLFNRVTNNRINVYTIPYKTIALSSPLVEGMIYRVAMNPVIVNIAGL